jgi:PEP-CTERM motif
MAKMSKIRILGLGIATMACGLALGSPAQATLMLTMGNSGGGTDNVVFNPCSGVILAGPTVQGCLNTSHTTLVDFTSTEDLVASGGQAKVGAKDGAFDNVVIKLHDPTLGFSKLVFNLDAINDGTATFQAVDNFGTLFPFSFALKKGGQNFFTLDSADNQVAVSFSLVSTVDIQDISDLEQVRLGVTSAGVPEPTTLGLIGLGLLGLGGMARRRRNAKNLATARV